ncbi:hypothetical protein SAMN05421823_10250 [Catalinimonas alkaloidigena]|uniref:Uncharacterized protein n=1 Tax=Catalinimonas alkaloidigena TaxID=1075417 RepID=A0A1G8ZSD2_9BACT|nr:hypothetical protein [Catalinimonas alkaloidigena]SDK17030.1 hypothetical protein SAMN05421823_10250 [Catalinimonas alkaloidigena]
MRLLLKFLGWGLFLLATGLTAFLFYLQSDFNMAVPTAQVEEAAALVRQAPSLPDAFYPLYAAVSDTVHTSGYLLQGSTGDWQRECPCLQAARRFDAHTHQQPISTLHMLRNDYTWAWKLEQRVSQRECLTYLMHQV